MPTPTGRYWLLTIPYSHYPEVELKHPALYIKGQREIGAGGLDHWQLMVISKKCTIRQLKVAFVPQAHVELSRSAAASEYVWKEDTRVPNSQFELGDPPISRARTEDWDRVWESAKKGAMQEIPADIRIKQYGTLKRIARDFMEKPHQLDGCCGVWIYGESGTGKSHAVITTYPDRYMKPLNKWWDGYQQEDVIHLDELGPGHASWIAPYLKKWADKWPFDAEVKGGALQLRPKKIIVTSNYSINQMGFSREDLAAIQRRFVTIEKFREQNILI